MKVKFVVALINDKMRKLFKMIWSLIYENRIYTVEKDWQYPTTSFFLKKERNKERKWQRKFGLRRLLIDQKISNVTENIILNCVEW